MQNIPKIAKRLSLIASLTLVSCQGNNRIWNYQPNQNDNTKILTNKTISVAVFEENLIDRGITKKDYTFLIPLAGSSKFHISAPDDGNKTYFDHLLSDIRLTDNQYSSANNVKSMYHDKPIGGCVRQSEGGEQMYFNPVISFSHALFTEIRASNIFKSSQYVCSLKDESVQTDYGVFAYIKDKSLENTEYGYRLGFINKLLPLTRVLGAKDRQHKMNLSIEMVFVDLKNDKVLFKKTYTESKTVDSNGFYYKNSYFTYPDLMFKINNKFISDIKKVIIIK